MKRAVRQIAPHADQKQLDESETVEMLIDVALFEPNQRGRRAYDRFLTMQGDQLGAADRALAERMAGAWFSIFRVAGRHEIAGLWLEDLLDNDRRVWIVDEGMEASATDGVIFGIRVFDTEAFHAGFGIVVPPDEMVLDLCVAARARDARLPLRQSLAATLYGDRLMAQAPPLGPADLDLLETWFEIAMSGLGSAGVGKARNPARSSRKRLQRNAKP